ncbi:MULTISPECIES: PH domain-containing protein [unclassified Mucilaginibacter]|uniref:PH domain-containing protein n=1 Tax=unclassified Mucilaginibacter TaxID=2617802 RepID=UPI002AC8B859|nr:MULTISPECIES: PH domain-containing protein [unclassified Mucilaginibacter]MEB0262725.1 PH domain-containing protein [Mucilaginibacter sp. 10I4]MEB0279496.1 PH domain-containing protein [Mucilaginibacter sp. 10B2]MEB0302794.1 PH domain-containing protein [Mucilaginibacter sp. 5C4]WPX22636.1 PH domain-containing protein [Mucilaginibacter sp. 5C4]
MTTADKVYPTKKGFIIYIVIGLLLIMEVSYFFNGLYLSAVLLIALTGVIVFPLLNTRYTITADNTLKVKCGFFVNLTIPIEGIRKITSTKTILSAPALSFDRYEVFYNKFDSVVISPINKKEFIADLQNINPAIEYIHGVK